VVRVHLEADVRGLLKQGQLVALFGAVEIENALPLRPVAKVQRHDVRAFSVPNAQPAAVAGADDLGQPVRVGHFPVFSAHFHSSFRFLR
jgi:hypothetical protein